MAKPSFSSDNARPAVAAVLALLLSTGHCLAVDPPSGAALRITKNSAGEETVTQ